jgi:hypothetical protein
MDGQFVRARGRIAVSTKATIGQAKRTVLNISGRSGRCASAWLE